MRGDCIGDNEGYNLRSKLTGTFLSAYKMFSEEQIHLGLCRAIEYYHGVAKEAGWWTDLKTGEDQTASPGVVAAKLLLLHAEISEAVEAFRKDKMDDHLPTRSGIEVELADLFIRLVDLCGALKLDLAGAVIEKGKYNAARADHKVENRQAKGGKKF